MLKARYWRVGCGTGLATALIVLAMAVPSSGSKVNSVRPLATTAAKAYTTVDVPGKECTASFGCANGFITNFTRYVDGKPTRANPKLPPVLLGWSSNNAGGTVTPTGPEASAATRFAVDWINKYAGGIDGHPLKLDSCIILNSEEEGLGCAEKFRNNAKVNVIAYGALAVGAATIDTTIAGKIPIVAAASQNPSDNGAKNLYIWYGGAAFGNYSWATFAKQDGGKSCAIIYPNVAAVSTTAASTALACKKAGLKPTLVAFDTTTSDLSGAFVAAGATKPGAIVMPLVNDMPSSCLSVVNAISQLHINPAKVLWYTGCQLPSIKAQYPGGDYPKFWSGTGQAGDPQANDPTGRAYYKVLREFGITSDYLDDWYSAMFSQTLTIARIMNEVGYAKLSDKNMSAALKAFKGPFVGGAPRLDCGEFRFAPNSCTDGNYFVRYEGNGNWGQRTAYLPTPPALVTELKAIPVGGSYPTH